MPPFVVPPPPAQVQYVSPRETDTRLVAETRGSSISPIPAEVPTVVEYHYAAPKPTLSSPLPPPAQAQQLGQPLSVHTEGTQGWKPSSTTLQPIVGLGQAQRLVTQARQGTSQEFVITPENPSPAPAVKPAPPPEVVELISDQQEYDSERQIVTATGNVVMRFTNGVLLADRLQVNLPDRFAVAEGNVTLERGDQTLKGQRFEYFFVLNKGVIYQANGDIYQPTTGRDLSPTLPTDPGGSIISGSTLNERLAANQPVQNITATDGLGVAVGGGLSLNQFGTAGTPGTSGGQVNRLRFQAERVDFDADGWNAKKVRITNDPFSPPELEVQAETADYYNVAPQVDEVKLSGSRVLLDQTTSLPFQDRLTIDRRDRQPGVLSIGYDGQDRGGLFIQSGFTPIDTKQVRFQVKPQYLIQKALFPDAFPQANQSESTVCALCPSVFGLITDLDVSFNERMRLINTLNFSNLNLDEVDNSLRAKLALQNKIGPMDNPHDLRVEYNYRERLFNGSLGFQTVNQSLGAVLVSPTINLGDPSFRLSYQFSIQDIQADTDQAALLSPNRENNLVTLLRYQGAASINKDFLLWAGTQLPLTPEEGLRYSPRPVVPYLSLTTGLTGVSSFYSDGSTQPSLTGSIGLFGQFGHFSRSYLDYTGFNITYFQGIRGEVSPFLFDRFADTQVLTWGLTQQVYGPLRVGIQSAYSIDANKEISTDYFLEYSRRTYNLQLRYNPQLQVGSINLRISDFNWSGNPGTFEGTDIRPVIQGVTR
ncbi:DUF3769 domain-containing protein [Synechocystis sp. LKSZ1]|uniref:DUF3769 domain-containing protein n=1 Tax=Synechocystis sp. LKSZ1 TaxID=3144951 RepID=UPI00336BEF3A